MVTWHSLLHEVEGGACLPCLAQTAHPLPSPDPLPVETLQAHVTGFFHQVFSMTFNCSDSSLNRVLWDLMISWVSSQAQIQLVAVWTATVQG